MIEKRQFIFALVRKPIKLLSLVPQTTMDKAYGLEPSFVDHLQAPGYYQLEEVTNPCGSPQSSPWYVLTGTMTGIASDAWQAKSDDPESGVTLNYRKTKHIYALVKGPHHNVNDGNKPINDEPIPLAPGYHELEIIPNPHGHKHPWYVLKGTKLGAACGSWIQWRSCQHKDWQLVVFYLREPLKRKRYQF